MNLCVLSSGMLLWYPATGPIRIGMTESKRSPAATARIIVPITLLALSIVACNHEPTVHKIEQPGNDGTPVSLLTQADGANTDDADLGGELRLVDGCLKIGREAAIGSETPTTIIWPEGYGIVFDGQTALIVNERRQVVARVGEPVLLGGSEGYSDPENIGGCLGPFWHAGPEVLSGDEVPARYR